MPIQLFQFILVTVLGFNAACSVVSSTEIPAQPSGETAAESIPADPKGEQTAVFAGGCFWGVEAVFEHVKGVSDVKSGYAGGTKQTANYDEVSSGRTKHAEAVEIKFDPAVVSYDQLLNIFFTVAHNPTELNRQGPDTGSQYRSAIFYTSEDQKKAAMTSIESMTATKAFSKPIVTEVSQLSAFFAAEDYHQDFMRKNPDHPYIVFYDKPKIGALKKQFPELYK